MHKKCLTMVAMLSIAYANNANFEQGKQMAQLGNASFKETASFKSFKAENYSNQPINSTTAESYFGKSDAEIKAAGVNAMATDKTVKSIQQHHGNRKPLNPVENPTLNRMKHIMQNSKEISHGQSTDKYRCSQVQANCVTKKVNRDCLSADIKTLQCYYKPEVRIIETTIPAQDKAFDLTSNRFWRTEPWHGHIYFNLPYTGVLKSIEVILQGNFPHKWSFFGGGGGHTHYWLRIQPFHPGLIDHYHNPNGIFSLKFNNLSYHTTANQQAYLWINGREWIRVPDFSLRYRGVIQVPPIPKKEAKIIWSNTCNPIYLNQCTKVKEVCIEPKATRTFGAESVTLDCWNYQQTYQCGNANINTCGQYQSCNFIQKVCNQTIGEYCVQHKETYQCTEEHCDSNQMLCGKPTAICLDGNCQSDDPEPNTGKDFAPSVSALAGLFAAGQDLKDQQQDKEGNFSVFKGKVADCGKAGLGIYNCCADNGGVVKNCSDSEKALYHARQKGFATQVGEYCAKRVLGACVLWHEGWCIFESKLARIINEQGRRQLGISFGDPKHPNCQGLTPEMLQQIKFDQVNFSEVFSDIASSKAFPNTQKLNDSIAKTAQATLQGLGK